MAKKRYLELNLQAKNNKGNNAEDHKEYKAQTAEYDQELTADSGLRLIEITDPLDGGAGDDKIIKNINYPRPPKKPLEPKWVLPIKQEFRDKIHKRESNINDYQAVNRPDNIKHSPALGRYQMKKNALIDAGMMDKNGNWSGQHGVNSEKDFLNSNKHRKLLFLIIWKQQKAMLIKMVHLTIQANK